MTKTWTAVGVGLRRIVIADGGKELETTSKTVVWTTNSPAFGEMH